MRPTLPYIQEKFKEYNALIFKNALPPLPMRIGNARCTLGGVSYKRKRKATGGFEFYDFKLTISARIDLPEDVVQDTLIHEMIHYYILSKQLVDSSPHGKLFRQLMNHINQHFNRHITVTHRSTPEERAQDTKKKDHFFCITELADGKNGITVVAKTRLFQLWRMLPHYFNIRKSTWYWSNDPFFNNFPKSISPRIFAVKPEDLKEHLSTATELVLEGNVIRKK